MHPELSYTIAKLHYADLTRAAERRRLARELAPTRRALFRSHPHVDVRESVHVDKAAVGQA